MKDIFKTIIKDFHTKEKPEVKKRSLNIPLNSNKIITLIGARRSGKTYFLYQLIAELLKTVPVENIIYINFEDERLSNKKEDLQFLIEAYYEMYPDNNQKLYFFFDEIQNISGWENFIRRIYDTISQNLFITGSSSKLLGMEIATALRGRSIVYEIYPLSFKEYLDFNDFTYTDIHSTRQKAKIKNLFNKFIFKGGFPEIIHYDDDLTKRTLSSYLDVMIYRDIIERYEVKNIPALKYLIKKGIANISNPISINKLYNELKSQGIKIGKDNLYEYMDHLNDCFLLFMVSMYSESIAMQNINEKKIYCIDNGLANLVSFKFSEDKGRLLENLLYIELKSRNFETYYFKNKNECDFLIYDKTKIIEAIQVTLELNDSNKEREINGLLSALNKFKLKEGKILTLDQANELKIENKIIHVIPLWKWLLSR